VARELRAENWDAAADAADEADAREDEL